MLGNDISNKQAPFVMMDIDSLMFLPKEKTVFTTIADLFKDGEKKYVERKIDPYFGNVLNRLWNNNNVCIGLFTFNVFERVEDLEDKLQEEFVPYTRIFSFREWEDLRRFQHCIYIFSANDELLSYLSRNDALPVGKIWEVLK